MIFTQELLHIVCTSRALSTPTGHNVIFVYLTYLTYLSVSVWLDTGRLATIDGSADAGRMGDTSAVARRLIWDDGSVWSR